MILINFLAIITLLSGFPDSVSTQINSFFSTELKSFDSFKIEPVNLPENIVAVKFLSSGFDSEKRIVSIPAEVKFEGGKVVKTFLSFRLHLFKKVLIAGTTIEKNSLLRPDDLIFGVAEVNNNNCALIYSLGDIENSVAAKKFLPGELLCRDYVEKAPVVRTGDRVKASFVSGNTVISFDAISRQDGKENEIIKVITRDKKIYKAKVINATNVSVAE
jgi:flagella basal body P-ring formation protein FlgA